MSRFNRVLKSGMFFALLIGLVSVSAVSHAAQGLPFKLPKSFIELPPLKIDREQQQWLETRGPLRVGISLGGYAPMDTVTDRNRYQGISADYLSLVRDKLGAAVQVLGFSKRDQAVAALLSGKIDILASANGYERGIEGMIFSTEYMVDRSVIVGRGDDSAAGQEWSGKKVGFLEGEVDEWVADAFYPNSEIILTPTLHSALEALSEGDIDALVGNEVIIRAFKTAKSYAGVHIVGDSALPVSGFTFATRRDDPQLLALIDRALSSLDDAVEQLILSRWTTGPGGIEQRIKLLPKEQAWIKQNPVVIVASQQYPPYIFKKAGEGWDGLSVDILARISRMTGLQFVHQESFSTVQTLEMLKSGKAQMNTTLSKNAERQAFLNFTYSYGGAPWVFVVSVNDFQLSSLAHLSGQVLALPAKHALEPMIRRDYPEITLRMVENYTQARQLVERGDAIATIQNETQAYLHPTKRLKVGRSVDGRWSSDNFSVSTQSPELLDILNKGLEALPVADMQAMRIKWLHETGKEPAESAGLSAPWVYAIMAAVIALGGMLVVWNRRLATRLRFGQQVESSLREHQGFQQRCFDAIPCPVFVKGLEAQMITCNRTYEEYFSTRLELICGRVMTESDFFPAGVAEQFHTEIMSVLRNRKPFYQKRSEPFKTVNGEVYCWIVPFYADCGHLEGVVGGWFDLSVQKKWGGGAQSGIF